MSLSYTNKQYMLFEPKSVKSDQRKETPRLLVTPIMLQNEYEDVSCQQTHDEDVENVRGLDIWHITGGKKNKNFDRDFSGVQSARAYSTQGKSKDMGRFPSVKTDLLDKILGDSEENYNGFPMIGFKMNEGEEKNKLPQIKREADKTFKTGEVTKMGYNEELLHEIVVKRMREQLNPGEVGKMNPNQLRLYIKAIAEEAVNHFKSLKGLLTPKLVSNYVYVALEMARGHRKGLTIVPKSAKEQRSWNEGEKPITNYEMSEIALIKELEHNAAKAKELRAIITGKDYEVFQLKKNIGAEKEKLNIIRKEYNEIGKELDNGANAGMGKKHNRRIAVADPNSIKDHMVIRKLKDAKKHEEDLVLEEITDMEKGLQKYAREIEQARSSMKAAKDRRIYYKLQLKNLYHQILKDEGAVMKGNDNMKSYAWVLRALWKIGEEVKDDMFPAIFDNKAIEFFISFAKLQDEVETYCRANNMMDLLSNLKYFKVLNLISQPQHQTSASQTNLNQLHPSNQHDHELHSNLDYDHISPPISATKSMVVLIHEYQEKASALKRVNLKTKRPVYNFNSLSPNKSNVSKWEEVESLEGGSGGNLYSNYPSDSLSNLDNIAIPNRTMSGEPKDAVRRLTTSHKNMDRATDLVNKMDEAKQREIERLTKQFVNKALDERTRLDFQKILRFFFGKEDGDNAFLKVMMDKKFSEGKFLSKAKKTTGAGPLSRFAPSVDFNSTGEPISPSERTATTTKL